MTAAILFVSNYLMGPDSWRPNVDMREAAAQLLKRKVTRLVMSGDALSRGDRDQVITEPRTIRRFLIGLSRASRRRGISEQSLGRELSDRLSFYVVGAKWRAPISFEFDRHRLRDAWGPELTQLLSPFMAPVSDVWVPNSRIRAVATNLLIKRVPQIRLDGEGFWDPRADATQDVILRDRARIRNILVALTHSSRLAGYRLEPIDIEEQLTGLNIYVWSSGRFNRVFLGLDMNTVRREWGPEVAAELNRYRVSDR